MSEVKFPLALAAMSVVMTIVWAMMFTTGDDDLFWTWVILSPVFLLCLGHNFSLKEGIVSKSIPFTISYALACLIWVVFENKHGHPWGWGSEQFSEIMWLSIVPPFIVLIWIEGWNLDYPEKKSLQRVGIIASLPFCVTGYLGLIFFIPTLVLPSIVRLFFHHREKRVNESTTD